MSAHICHRVARYLADKPHFIEPFALKAMLDVMGPRFGLAPMAGEDEGGESFAQRKRRAERERLAAIVEAEIVTVGDGLCEYALTREGIAVVPILGMLVNRYDWLAALCGWASYDTIGAMMQAAAANGAVKAILLDVDSPGGEAAGMLDCADLIREMAREKPVWASANTLAASAAFGLASAASRLTLPRLGSVGSVGVVGIHIDQSAFDKEMGLKYTPIYSGARKIDGWGHAPLSSEAKERFQAQFDEARRKFAEAVARHRRMTIEAVLETEAAVYDDQEGVGIGFADEVRSFDETLAELTKAISPSSMQPRSLLAAPTPDKGATTMTTKNTTGTAEKPENQPEPAPLAPVTTGPAAPASPPAPAATAKADPAEVAAYCVANGAAGMIAGLIREGATMDQVKAKVDAASAIRKKVEQARPLNPDAIKPELADEYIKANLSVAEVGDRLLMLVAAKQSPEIRGAIAPDTGAEKGAVINREAIYAKRRQKVAATAA